MNRAPAFQFYPDKAIAGTRHLSPEAFKAYWSMLWWMWLHSPTYCSINDTDSGWKIATGINDQDTLDSVRAEIMSDDMPMLKKRRQKLYSNGLEKEIEKIQTRRANSSKGGRTTSKRNKDKVFRAKSTTKSTTKSTKDSLGVHCVVKQHPPTPTPSPTIPQLLDTPLFVKAWAEWQAHRRQIKKGLTELQAQKQINQFADWGVKRSVAAINHTIKNGWQGIYEPKGDDAPSLSEAPCVDAQFQGYFSPDQARWLTNAFVNIDRKKAGEPEIAQDPAHTVTKAEYDEFVANTGDHK